MLIRTYPGTRHLADLQPKLSAPSRGHLCIKGRFGWEWVNRRE